ncbi:hypothetical protein RUM44_008538 [Polyplax serrata]|uniref:Uncharacterized protein n=1 Tax=Polyplax serrata TaxID=468196 RepID=A0ABR1BDF4_POLSC
MEGVGWGREACAGTISSTRSRRDQIPGYKTSCDVCVSSYKFTAGTPKELPGYRSNGNQQRNGGHLTAFPKGKTTTRQIID